MARTSSSVRTLVEIDPHCEWVQGPESDTLIVDVTGFKKEQLRVQIAADRSLKVRGELSPDGQRLIHFAKRFELPEESDTRNVQAKLDLGMLYVVVPRVPASGDEDTVAESQDGYSGGNTAAAEELSQLAHPRRSSVMRGLIKMKLVILNIVLAVVLLWLISLARNKEGDAGRCTDLL